MTRWRRWRREDKEPKRGGADEGENAGPHEGGTKPAFMGVIGWPAAFVLKGIVFD